MSQTIDERVVEMRFNNREFESGVKESLSTLDKLKSALNLEGSAKSFETLDKAANHVDLQGISAGVEVLQNRFSTLGIVSMRVIENLTDSLMNMASKAMNYVSDAIISGGLKRAQNIENAHFQLQALLKDEEKVQAIMDNAMASVDGTAYAYDEAAKAAAQFAASGMEAGEKMEGALKGITGVAAMTNSEYEGISRIFTTVAGNGRLMGDQLLQLSSRGLNAASTIADYFKEVRGQSNMTESQIREMVTKGQIDFETFASAMEWAFGESAFRANETFTGALSNMKSALARIGAGFFSPLIEQNSDLVMVINALREKFNDIKKALVFDEQTSAISGLANKINLMTENVSQFVKDGSIDFSTFTSAILGTSKTETELEIINNRLAESYGRVKDAGFASVDVIAEFDKNGIATTKAITDYINGILDGSIRVSNAVRKSISEITGGNKVAAREIQYFAEQGKISYDIFTDAIINSSDTIKIGSQLTTDIVTAMMAKVREEGNVTKETLNEFNQNGISASRALSDYINGVSDGTIRASYSTKQAIEEITGGTKIAAREIQYFAEQGKISYDIFQSAMENMYGDQRSLSKQFTDFFLDTAKSFTTWLKNLDVSDAMDVLYYGVDSIKNIVKGLLSVLQPIGSAFKEVFTGLNMGNVVSIASKIEELTSKMKLSEENSKNLHDAFKGIADIVKLLYDGFIKLLSALLPLKEPISSIGDGILRLAGFIGRVLSNFAELIRKSQNVTKVFTYMKNGVDIIIGAFSKAISIVTNFGQNVKDVFNNISFNNKVFDSIKEVVDGISGKFSELKSKIGLFSKSTNDAKDSTNFEESASQIHIFGDAIKVLASIIEKSITFIGNGLTSFINLIKNVGNSIREHISNISFGNGGKNPLSSISESISNSISNLKTSLNSFSGATESVKDATNLSESSSQLDSFKDNLGSFVDNIKKDGTNIEETSTQVKSFGDTFGTFSDNLGKDTSIISKVGEKLSEFFGFLSKSISDGSFMDFIQSGVLVYLEIQLATLPKRIGDVVKSAQKFIDSFARIGTSISKAIDSFRAISDNIAGIGKSLKSNLDARALKKLAIAVAILGVTMYILSKIDTDRLITSLGAISVLISEMAGIMYAFSQIKMTDKEINESIKILLTFSASIYILALSIKKIAKLDMDKMIASVVAVSILISEMAGIMYAFTQMKMTDNEINKSIKSLISFSISIYILASSVKKLTKLDTGKMIGAMIAVSALIFEMAVIMSMISDLDMTGRELNKSMQALTTFASSILILTISVKKLSDLDTESLIKGIVGVSALIGELYLLMFGMSKIEGTNVGQFIGIFILSTALLVLQSAVRKFAGMSWEEITKGLVAIGAALAEFGVFLTLVNKEQLLATSVSLLAMIGAMNILVMVLENAGKMSWEDIVKGLVLFAGALTVIGTAAYVLEPILPAIKSLAKTIQGIAIASLLGGVAVLVFAKGLQTLAAISADASESIVILLRNIILGFLNLITDSYSTILQAANSLISLFCESLLQNAPLLVDTLFGLIISVISRMADNMPEIVNQLARLITGVITALNEHIPEIIDSVITLFKTIFSKIKEALSDIDTGDLTEALKGLGLVAAILGALAGIAALTPLAMLGVAGLGALIFEIATVLAGIGKLAEIPGVKELIDGSGSILQSIGTAIGQFIGGFVGGFADGVTSRLPSIATDLSLFMANIQPFILGVSLIDPSMLDGVDALVKTILLITAADVVNGILSFFGKDMDLSSFGEKIKELGPYIKDFSDSIKGIDNEAVTAAASAVAIITEMAKGMPYSENSIMGMIFGKKSLSEFAEELKPFGEALVNYCKVVAGKVDQEAVEASKAAVDLLIAIANDMPYSENSIMGMIFGKKNLADFAAELKPFGEALVDYCEVVRGNIDQEAVEASKAAADLLVTLNNSIPESGGIKQWFTGEKSFSTFGQNLVDFGGYLADYSSIIINVNASKISMVTSSVMEIISLLETISRTEIKKVNDFVTALNSIGTIEFEQIVTNFQNGGTELKITIGETIDQITEQVKSAGEGIIITLSKAMMAKKPIILTSISEICSSIITAYKRGLPNETFNSIGKGIISALTTGMSSEKINLVNISQSLSDSILDIFKNTLSKQEFENVGAYISQGLADGIRNKINEVVIAINQTTSQIINGARQNLQIHSPSKVMYEIGSYVSKGLANGISDSIGVIKSSSEDASDTAVGTMRNMIKKIGKLLETDPDFEPTIRPVLDLSNVESGMDKISSMFDKQKMMMSYSQSIEASNSFALRKHPVSENEWSKLEPSSSSVNLIQNNYSPKALSRVEIYRDTKNLLSTVKGVVKTT